MMKYTLLLISILAGSLPARNCYAQEKQKEESYNSLKSRSSRAGIQELVRKADDLKIANPAQALNLVQDALGMSIAQGDEFNESKCYLLLGEINAGIAEWSLALTNYEKASQKLFANYGSTSEYQVALRGLGTMHLRLENYAEALHYFQETLNHSTNNAELAERQLDISEVYYKMGNYDEALRVVQEIKVGSKIKNESLDSKIQNQKAKIYARTNEVDKANDFYQSSQRISRAAGKAAPKDDEDAIQNTKEEISDAFREQKRYDEDITLRNQSIDFNLESENLNAVSKDKIELSKSLAAKGETNHAIRELEEAALLADTINNPAAKADAYRTLAELYEKNNRPMQALTTYKKYSIAITQAEKQQLLIQQEKAELIKKQREIEEQSSLIAIGQQQEQTTLQQQRLIIYGLLVIIAIVLITSYFIFKNGLASKRANQLLALKSLRSQMNPHFIFNALNSVNHFVSQNDERTANKFLSEFSRLMRLVMENSQEDFISLLKEEEIISLYLKLEHYRFRDKFDYQIHVDDALNKETILLPPMLIQPYIENAVWHGLRYKESKGNLAIHLDRQRQDLQVTITDNGIGRKKSAQSKTENQKKQTSTGIKNIEQRLDILNTIYKTRYRVVIEDLPNESGTRVTISVPMQNITSV